jgi:P27 family predicted phage terminase small subunit
MPKTASLQVDAELDAAILDAFAAWVDIQQRAIAEVEEAGQLVRVTPNGHEQKIPQLNVLADATAKVLALAQQLGRTPASRVRLGVDGEPEPGEDDVDLPALPARKRA